MVVGSIAEMNCLIFPYPFLTAPRSDKNMLITEHHVVVFFVCFFFSRIYCSIGDLLNSN